jgi:hypothetical protein
MKRKRAKRIVAEVADILHKDIKDHAQMFNFKSTRDFVVWAAITKMAEQKCKTATQVEEIHVAAESRYERT